ncbi:nucleoside-diphosphate sugar epimerase [Niallia sp. 01092]|uniref:nucleoside-diphosphate sugar epimerase n=1 Tax=unclassified Niallia TaxID=2837522 RepID=UPI003FD0C92B
MYYQQSNLARKLIEATFAFLLLGITSQVFHVVTPSYEYLLLVFIVMLFSIRYGIYLAIFSFIEAFLYTIVIGLLREEAVILYFYSVNQWVHWFFLFSVSICCGFFSTSYKERYEDVHLNKNELEAENEELKNTVEHLNESRIKLKSSMLESDNQLSKLFYMFKELNHSHPEVLLDEGLNVLKEYFNAKRIGIYYVNSTRQTLRLKLRSEGKGKALPATIFVEKGPAVIKNALTHGRAFFRTIEDPDDAPLLVGPVINQDQIQYVIVLDDIEFSNVTSQQFELFVWFLRWMGDRLGHALDTWKMDISSRTIPGTVVYHASEFHRLVAIEKKRQKILDYPYSYLTMKVPESSLKEISKLVKQQLRDIDYLGYSMEEQILMILLPCTEEKHISVIEERVWKAVSTRKEAVH